MSRIHASYPGGTTLLVEISVSTLSTRLSLSLALLSRRLLLIDLGMLNHHIFCNFHCRIQLAFLCFRSLLLTESQLFSLPPANKMFQFAGCAFLMNFQCYRNCFKFGNPGIDACMRLPQVYRSLPRPSSQSKPSYPSSRMKMANKLSRLILLYYYIRLLRE